MWKDLHWTEELEIGLRNQACKANLKREDGNVHAPQVESGTEALQNKENDNVHASQTQVDLSETGTMTLEIGRNWNLLQYTGAFTY